ncbi:hypothetical protein, partial [Dokdonella sp.]|uniref:hypothetical protein n=1 Tax=Dokdonella sp. TaxID=2291710 RepID=UPI0037847862
LPQNQAMVGASLLATILVQTFPGSLYGRSHPAATSLPSIDWVNRQDCIEPAMRTFRLIH